MVDLGAVGVDARPGGVGAAAPTTRTRRRRSPTCILPDRAVRRPGRARRGVRRLRHVPAAQRSPTATTPSPSPGSSSSSPSHDVPDGPVYAEGDEHVARALAMRDAFGPFWDRAAGARHEGVPAHRHAHPHHAARAVPDRARSARSTPTNPDLWDVYAAGLDELYAAEPVARRRARSASARPAASTTSTGWDYYSALAVTTVGCRARDAHGAHRRRPSAPIATSSSAPGASGVGAVGDMHTNPQSYARGARRHRLAGPHRLDEVHARRLLQPPAAQRHARSRAASGGSSSSRAAASSRASARSPTTSAREYQ